MQLIKRKICRKLAALAVNGNYHQFNCKKNFIHKSCCFFTGHFSMNAHATVPPLSGTSPSPFSDLVTKIGPKGMCLENV